MENFEWNNLSLGEPYWLFLLLLLPGVLWLSRRKKKTQAIKFPSIVEIKKTRKSWKTKLLWLPKLFLYLGLVLQLGKAQGWSYGADWYQHWFGTGRGY